jgi:hypothetical protein
MLSFIFIIIVNYHTISLILKDGSKHGFEGIACLSETVVIGDGQAARFDTDT